MKEFEELRDAMKNHVAVVKYVPTEDVHKTYLDGGVAIIDQSICSHARSTIKYYIYFSH